MLNAGPTNKRVGRKSKKVKFICLVVTLWFFSFHYLLSDGLKWHPNLHFHYSIFKKMTFSNSLNLWNAQRSFNKFTMDPLVSTVILSTFFLDQSPHGNCVLPISLGPTCNIIMARKRALPHRWIITAFSTVVPKFCLFVTLKSNYTFAWDSSENSRSTSSQRGSSHRVVSL